MRSAAFCSARAPIGLPPNLDGRDLFLVRLACLIGLDCLVCGSGLRWLLLRRLLGALLVRARRGVFRRRQSRVGGLARSVGRIGRIGGRDRHLRVAFAGLLGDELRGGGAGLVFGGKLLGLRLTVRPDLPVAHRERSALLGDLPELARPPLDHFESPRHWIPPRGDYGTAGRAGPRAIPPRRVGSEASQLPAHKRTRARSRARSDREGTIGSPDPRIDLCPISPIGRRVTESTPALSPPIGRGVPQSTPALSPP